MGCKQRNNRPTNEANMSHDGLIRVRNGIRAAALAAGRNPHDVTLVAVSKTFEASDIIPVIEAGQRIFGENRVQEAQVKWPTLRVRWPDIELHLIGPLQSNKAAEAVALFDCIQTIDRPKIAQAIAAEMKKQGRQPILFVQVNIGREPQKAGVAPEDCDGFIARCRSGLGLAAAGLMCIPPLAEDPAPYFNKLAEIATRNGIKGLSMGMSGDYAAAIKAGATVVRVGSAIFGQRPPAGG
jgi:pyridoxal phosphate enzyme (YggS family)